MTTPESPRPRRSVTAMPAYVAGRTPAPGAAKLSSNENPYPPLPGVIEAAAAALATLNRYPDNGSTAVVQALAAKLAVPAVDLALTNGSVSMLHVITSAFCEPGDEVVYAWRSFEAYPIVTLAAGAVPVQVPLLPDGRHDLDAMAAAVTERTKVVLLCTPNNPTGPALTQVEVDAFLARVPAHVLVVLDEAYLEFVRLPGVVDGIATYRAHANVMLTRTFSKAYGLAALRVGYAVAPAPIADALRRVTPAFTISSVAQAATVASLAAEDELLQRVEALVAERDRVVAAIAETGWRVPDAQGNFVWFPTGPDGIEPFVDAAERLDLVVRPLGDGVRVSIGDPEANDRVIALAQQTSPALRG